MPLQKLLKAEWSGLLLVVILAIMLIGYLKPSFLTPFNIQILLAAISVNMVIALAQMLIVGIGQMNLSVGAIGGLVAISFAGLMDVFQLPIPLAVLVGLLIGLAAGLFNGVIIAFTGISAFIITLASLSVFKGINLGITEAQPFYGVAESVKSFGNSSFIGTLPLLILPALLALIGVWFLLNRMRFGRHVLAVGASPTAAGLVGISVRNIVIGTHALSGLLAAVAGMMVVARLQIGQPTIGDDWLILSFAAPVIGGAVLAGGHVNVIGTLLGVTTIAIITQALVLFEIDPFIVQIFLGLLILWAVGINRLRDLRLTLFSKPA
ncbi:MAG: ABC transporter permease, partial [bacterium]